MTIIESDQADCKESSAAGCMNVRNGRELTERRQSFIWREWKSTGGASVYIRSKAVRTTSSISNHKTSLLSLRYGTRTHTAISRLSPRRPSRPPTTAPRPAPAGRPHQLPPCVLNLA